MTRRSHLLESLPVSARDRRAIEETVADWRHEREAESSAVRRVAIDFRGTAAVAAALLLVALGETRQRSAWTTVAVAALLAAAFTLLSFTWTAPRHLFSSGLAPAAIALGLAALIPQGIAICFAPMIAALPFRSRAGVPLLGTAIAATTAMLVLTGWIVPESNQWFRAATFSHRAAVAGLPATSPESLPRGLSEFTIVDLVRDAAGDGRVASAARRQLLLTSGLIAWAPAACLLGFCARRFLDRRRGRRWLLGVLPVVVMATVPAAALVLSVAPRHSVELQVWTAVALTLTLCLPFRIGAAGSVPHPR